MSKAEIKIEFYNGEANFDTTLFHPGEVLNIGVTIYPEESFECKNLYARLLWHTEGRGTRYKENVEEVVLFQGEFMNGMPQTYECQFRLPEEPWSYDGYYISTIWKVEVQLDVAWALDPKEARPFLLRPAGS